MWGQELINAAKEGKLAVIKRLVLDRTSKEKQDALLGAASNGHLDVVQFLVEQGTEVNNEHFGGKALGRAAENGHSLVVRYLVGRGVNVNATYWRGDTALIKASESGHLDLVRFLVQACKARVNVRNWNGETALINATLCGHIDVVQFLADFGADVNGMDEGGRNLLILAAAHGRIEALRYLVSSGADVNVTDNYRYTALMWAARRGHVDAVRYLVECEAQVNATDNYGDTALMWAARGGHLAAVECLTRVSEDVDSVDAKGDTALMWAAEWGHIDAVKHLARWGTSIDIADERGHTALMKATTSKHVDVVRYLVQFGADVNVPDRLGCTALLSAAASGRLDIVQILTEKGDADVNAVDEHQETALMKAAASKHLNVVRHLVEQRGINVNAKNCHGFTALVLAVKWGDAELVRCLAEHPGGDVNAINQFGCTALMKAAINGRVEIVRYLVGQRVADVDISDEDGDTALMLAAERGHIEVVSYLVECRADVNSQNKNGSTALIWAAERGHLNVVRCLAQQSCTNVNITDTHGSTALMKAAENERVDVVQYLTHQPRVDVNARNHCGETALRLAANRGYQDIQRILTPFHRSTLPEIYSVDVTGAETCSLDRSSSYYISPSEVELTELFQTGNIGGEYRAKWIDADAVVKLYIPDASHAAFEVEVHLWQQLRHPNVIKMYGACDAGRYLKFFVCEFASNGSLAEYYQRKRIRYTMKGNMSSEVLVFLHEAALGLEFLHERDIVHGDLRCSNILIGSDGLAKLSNFALSSSKTGSNQPVLVVRGSMRWQAPEILKGEQLSFESDVYSLGMCFLEAVTMKIPWVGESEDYVRKYKMSWPPEGDAAINSGYVNNLPPGDLCNLIWRMCCRNPHKRTSLSSVICEIEHIATKETVVNWQQDEEVATKADCHANSSDSYETELWMHLENHFTTCHNDQHCQVFDKLKRVRVHRQNGICHPELQSKFQVLLTEFYHMLMIPPEQSRIMLLSSSGTTTNHLYALDCRLESLLIAFGELVEGIQDRETRWQRQRSKQIEAMVTGVLVNTSCLLSGLKTLEEKAAFLRTLKTAMMRRSQDLYTPAHIRAMQRTYQYIEQQMDGNDVVPDWFIPQYEVLINERSCLGSGGFGSVYKVKWLDSDVVVKVIGTSSVANLSTHRDSVSALSDLIDSLPSRFTKATTKAAETLEMFYHEADIWFRLSHPHVVRLFGACHVGRTFFVCEYATNGTLVKYLQQHPEEIWSKLYEAALGVQYLHARGIVHGDLKGNNIVIGRDKKAKVTDFGLSSMVNYETTPQTSAAWNWLAPECLPNSNSRPTFASDVYSLGMCIVEALRIIEAIKSGKGDGSNCLPWCVRDLQALKYHASKGTLPAKPNCDDHEWKLVERMCALDPTQRIKISTVVDELAKLANTTPRNSEQSVLMDEFLLSQTSTVDSISKVTVSMHELLDRLQVEAGGANSMLPLYVSLWNRIERIHDKVNDNQREELYAALCSIVAEAEKATLKLQCRNESLISVADTTMRCHALGRRLTKFCEAYFINEL